MTLFNKLFQEKIGAGDVARAEGIDWRTEEETGRRAASVAECRQDHGQLSLSLVLIEICRETVEILYFWLESTIQFDDWLIAWL